LAADETEVYVEVIDVGDRREISWRRRSLAKFGQRAEEVRVAVEAAAMTVAEGLQRVPDTPGWAVAELSAKFGVTLMAEAGVVLSRASAEAAIELTVVYRRV
jgi:hypothetical protein